MHGVVGTVFLVIPAQQATKCGYSHLVAGGVIQHSTKGYPDGYQ